MYAEGSQFDLKESTTDFCPEPDDLCDSFSLTFILILSFRPRKISLVIDSFCGTKLKSNIHLSVLLYATCLSRQILLDIFPLMIPC